MTSSFQFRERSPHSVGRVIRRMLPGEIVRGHLFYDAQAAAELSSRSVVHYLIYRDPRDIVVSEAHYLRELNRWHRLHRHFARLASLDDAIALSITGFDPPLSGIEYPNIAERFSRYRGWLDFEDCLAIRFEDLRSAERQPAMIRRLADFYAQRCDRTVKVDECAQRMTACIAPEKSHTFRSGKTAGWKGVFTPEHCRLFDRFAGQLLIDLGYEPSHDWATVASTI